MKSLFIRCSEETYELAHALAKKENRSLNKQIIHMIHSLADDKDVKVKQEVQVETVEAVASEPKWGLERLVQTKKQDSSDQ
jgi:hypothetical protein|tara:strand:+ start:348 stop:590 length:243 start_codon:yes stop_codon:yes gene_type:complete